MPAAVRPELGQLRMLHKTFRPYDQDTLLLMPPSLHDWVADDGLVAYLNDLVCWPPMLSRAASRPTTRP